MSTNFWPHPNPNFEPGSKLRPKSPEIIFRVPDFYLDFQTSFLIQRLKTTSPNQESLFISGIQGLSGSETDRSELVPDFQILLARIRSGPRFSIFISPGFAQMFQIFTGPDDRDRIRTPDRELEFSIFENLILVEKVNLKGRFGPRIPGSFVTNLQTRPSYCSLHFGPD